MKYSQDSEKLLEILFSHQSKIKYNNNSKLTNKILINFYNDIKKSDNKINKLFKSSQIKKVFMEKNIYPDLFKNDNGFLPKNIKYIIENRSVGTIKYITILNKVKITVNILMFNKKTENMIRADKIFKMSLKWLDVILNYINHEQKEINIFLYLTSVKKKKKTYSKPLDGANVNTAITYACQKDAEILIYRYEEWFKVLMHETMHALCLDFSMSKNNGLKLLMKNIKKLFPIESKFELYEAYSEFWATLLNICFVSYFNLYDKNEKNYLLYTNFNLNLEKTFSLLQTIKVLHKMNIIDYQTLYKKDRISRISRNLYKEKTNVFCYYILKMILLVHLDDFLLYCNTNNTNIIKFHKENNNSYNYLFKFIKEKHNSKKLLNWLEKAQNINENIDDVFFVNTTRMTSVEIDI